MAALGVQQRWLGSWLRLAERPAAAATSASTAAAESGHQPTTTAAAQPTGPQRSEQSKSRATEQSDASKAAKQPAKLAAEARNGWQHRWGGAESDAAVVRKEEDGGAGAAAPVPAVATRDDGTGWLPAEQAQVSGVWQDLLEQFESQAAHRQRAHGTD